MKRSLVVLAAGAVLAILLGSVYLAMPQFLNGSSSSTSGPNGGSVSVALSAQISTSSQGSTAVVQDWTTYHGDNSRTGYVPVSNFTSVTNAWNSTTLDGAVYAEPLVYGGDVLVATENNSVYSLSAT